MATTNKLIQINGIFYSDQYQFWNQATIETHC